MSKPKRKEKASRQDSRYVSSQKLLYSWQKAFILSNATILAEMGLIQIKHPRRHWSTGLLSIATVASLITSSKQGRQSLLCTERPDARTWSLFGGINKRMRRNFWVATSPLKSRNYKPYEEQMSCCNMSASPPGSTIADIFCQFATRGQT